MLIKDIKATMSGLDLKVKVIDKSPITIHNGKKYASAIIEDSSGKIKLNLWRDQAENVELGDIIILEDVFAHIRGRSLQVSTWSDIKKDKK